jgi:NAD(P)-dependent dehydrogenase (short-subunit alcohol dehydrogenase family)
VKPPILKQILPQHQDRQPAIESAMVPPLQSGADVTVRSGRLEGKVALITGGDGGIGRAVAIAFAKEGADIAFIYRDAHGDALQTAEAVRASGRRCLKIPADVGDEGLCRDAVEEVLAHFGRLDILVNNAAGQHPQEKLEDISEAQLLRTFQCNVFSMFYLTKVALPHMRPGARIINTTSVIAYRGNPRLVDYSAAKGAVVTFTRSLSLALVERGILVNAVAQAEEAAHTPMRRPGRPEEIADCYVFLASAASSYMSGQVLHPNGGEIING